MRRPPIEGFHPHYPVVVNPPLVQCVRRGLVAHPEPEPERRLAPFPDVGLADSLAGADQRSSALELL